MRRVCMVAVLAISSALTSCGGGDPEFDRQAQLEHEMATARTRLAQFNALVSTAPCSTSAQCSTIRFKSGRNDCERPAPVDYSMAAATAPAARKAAADYDAAMQRAQALVPADDATLPSCTVVVEAMPLQCIDNRCVRGFSFPGE